MEFLYYENGRIQVTEELLSVPVFKDMYDTDKSKAKGKFRYYMLLMWYMHSESSPYDNINDIETERLVNEKHVTGRSTWGDLLGSIKGLRACRDEYIKLTMSREKQQYKKLMDDIDAYIEFLNDIPLKKKVSTYVDDTDDEGKDIRRKVTVDFINSDERLAAQKALKDMYNLADYLKERIKKQGTTVKRRYKRIFDKIN